MAQLGQASGGWTESSSALRVEHAGIFNSTGVLVEDAFTQTNPPTVTAANTISDKVDTTKLGVLGGSVAFTRPDDSNGNAHGGPLFTLGPLAVAKANVHPIGVYVNSALGNAFENTPGVASGKGTYMSSMGTYSNQLYETQVLTGNAVGNDLTAYTPGQSLYASWNGYLTNAIAADYIGGDTTAMQVYEGNTATFGICTVIGIVKMAPDSVQNELLYDQRI